jgi:hypothetical protein
MKLPDFTTRYAIPAFGIGVRWLREELQERGVSVRLTEACLREFAADAAAAATLETASEHPADTYAHRLRRQIAARAEFLRSWTRSDDSVSADDLPIQHLASIARKYALPRAWILSEPTASKCLRPTPTYLYWASAS